MQGNIRSIISIGQANKRIADSFLFVFNLKTNTKRPRPIMLNQQQLYGPNFCHYIRVVPGITGLWQISGRNRTSFAQRTAFDAEYINNWTIWSDIYILVRTAWVVLRRDGAC